MDFGNRYLAELFSIGNITVYLTDTLLATWVVMAVLIGFALVVRLRLSRFTDRPTCKLQNVVELMVETLDKLGRDTMGPELMEWGGMFFGLFGFVLISNYIGMFGLRPPTADLATTAALALTVFVVIHFMGIKRRKGRYFKSLISPNPIFLPINLISDISTPVSLCFRLFGNVLGGYIIMGMVYNLLPRILTLIVPDPLHLYFDLMVGALQAYIFTVLGMTFLQQKADPED